MQPTQQQPPPPGTLVATTLALLRADPRSLPQLYTDSKLPFYWLKKFKAGEITEPSANRVQALYEFLTKKPLLNRVATKHSARVAVA